jgi:CBS domain-containing protein
MKAADIMTAPAVTVTPQTTLGEVAVLLAERGISAVPVVEEDRLVGIVSEADLLHRHEIGTDCALRGDPWWLRMFRLDSEPAKYVRSHAVRVADIMTRKVAVVDEDAPLAEVADALDRRRVKRLPVTRNGRVIGIVSRSDLVAALATSSADRAGAAPQDDEAILARLLAELNRQPWWRADLSMVTVLDGVVTYRGLMDVEGERAAARVAAEAIPGVRRVEDLRGVYADFVSMV